MLSLTVLAGLVSAAEQAPSGLTGSPSSLVAADSSSCAASGVTSSAATYQTVVTVHAGSDSIPELYTNRVTLSWCTDGSGDVQILSSSQAPSVEASGFSVPGAEIALLNFVGFGFGVTPAATPAPTIDNETSYASTTASGLSFNEDFNLGKGLLALAETAIGAAITARLAAELAVLIRSGHLGSIGTVLLQWWEALAANFSSWAEKNFGLPSILAATLLENLPIKAIIQEVRKLAEPFVSTVTQTLETLNTNPTLASVIDAVKSGIQQIASSLDFPWVEWAPQITVTVRLVATVDVNGTVGPGITVESPTRDTTP